MNKFKKYLKIIVFTIGIFILLSVLFSGCDKLRCYPEYSPKGNYLGFKCEGDW